MSNINRVPTVNIPGWDPVVEVGVEIRRWKIVCLGAWFQRTLETAEPET